MIDLDRFFDTMVGNAPDLLVVVADIQRERRDRDGAYARRLDNSEEAARVKMSVVAHRGRRRANGR